MTPNMSKAAIRENANVEVITGPPPAKEFLAREDHSQGVQAAKATPIERSDLEKQAADLLVPK